MVEIDNATQEHLDWVRENSIGYGVLGRDIVFKPKKDAKLEELFELERN